MQTGTVISGFAHASLLSFAVLSGLDLWPIEPVEQMQVSTVSLVRSEVFDLMASSAPAVPQTEIDDQAAPDTNFTAPVAPESDIAPVETVIDETATPDGADLEPDLSALERLEQPEVVNVNPVFDSTPEFNESAPQVFQPALAGNELNAPVSMSAPPPPRNAPRIDTTAAQAPPEDAQPDTQNAQEVSDAGTQEVQEQAQESTAVAESTTAITPEGQEDVQISAYAPQSAARPPRRPRRLEAVSTPDPDTQNDDEVLAALIAEQLAEAATAPQPVAELSGVEKSAIGDVIGDRWNKVSITGLPDYEQYVVRIAVNVDAFGVIEGDVEAVEPASPEGYYLVAFNAARRAILQSRQVPLPSGVFPDGVRLILRFDPASGEIGLN